MTRIKTLAFSLFCGMFALNSLSQEPKVITWATNPNYPPYDWRAPDSEYDGACIPLLEKIIPEGYVLRPVHVPWTRAQKMAEEGSIDLLVNLRITPERSRWLVFSKNPTFPNPIAVFMRKDKAISFNSWDDLIPLRGGVTVGDAFGNGFDEYLKNHLYAEAIPNANSNFRKLDTGRIDYFVTGYYMGMAWLASRNLQDRIVALKPFISNNPIHLGFSKRSPYVGLLPEIDNKLAQLDAQGTLSTILEEHLKKASQLPTLAFPK